MSRINIDIGLEYLYEGSMPELLTIKVDPRMKAALRKLAENQFISVSAVVKQVIDRHLKEQGINWREEAKGKKRRK